jgi:AcrR family transcriptional regulator
MTEAGTGTRRPRTDARRNRTRILEVAEEFFAEAGITGSLDALARRAGVGAGTLYRHFPNRDALLAALLQARNEELEAQLEALRQEADAAVALEHWLDALGEWVTAFDGLPDPLRAALSQESSPLAITCQGFIATTEEFLGAAQREGTARSWVRGRDLFLAALSTAWVRGAAMADEASAQAVREMIRSGWATPRPEGAPAS